jgi:soluble lytic murein transglycosylase
LLGILGLTCIAKTFSKAPVMLVSDSSTRAGAAGPWRCFLLLATAALWLAGLGGAPSFAAAPKASPAAPAAEPVLAEAALPLLLSPADAALYQRILALQADQATGAADKLIASLKDRRLLGHVLAARYLDARARPSYGDLAGWLAAYADQAEAGKLYRLAQKMHRPAGAAALHAPAGGPSLGGNGDDDPAWRDQAFRIGAEDKSSRALDGKIRDALKHDNVVLAQHLLAGSGERLDALFADALKIEIAARLFADGHDLEALALAQQAARSGRRLPQASWIAGLASWRLNKRDQAQKYFVAAADSPAAVPSMVAAASFWAGRAALVTRHPQDWTRWMSRAAATPTSFYGLLAMRALGRDGDFNWSLPALGSPELHQLQSLPGVARSLMLIQIGEREAAEAELRQTAQRVPANLQPLLLTIAERGGMPGLATRLAGLLHKAGGPRYDAALFPVPPWIPRAGFTLNRALIYAIMRQESHFDPDAKSHAGALGLMQLMPGTAEHVDKRPGGAQQTRERLRDPEINVGLAQRLIGQLLGQEQVRGNLFRLAAAYNGGLGKLTRMQEKGPQGSDPLLFIESIPSAETRFFLEHILSNYWIYQTRFGQPTESLDALAAGDWPIYTPDPGQIELADRNARN